MSGILIVNLNRNTGCYIVGSHPPLIGHSGSPSPPVLLNAHLGKVGQRVGLIIHFSLFNLHTPKPGETGVRVGQVTAGYKAERGMQPQV